MNYEIFTDSSANLTDEMIGKLNLNMVSLVYFMEGEQQFSYIKGRDNDQDLKNVYTSLREKKEITTSCINQTVFEEAFEPTLKQGKDILYIGFSSGLSATYQSSVLAAKALMEKYPERKIITVDTRAASLGQGLLVYYACLEKEKGKTMEEVESWLENNKFHLAHWFTVEDLYWLFKGGRVSKTAYLIGNFAKIKPVLHMDNDGHLIPMEKVIGRKKSLITLADKVAKTIVNPEEQMIFISHGDCQEDVDYLIEKVKERITVKGFYTNYVDSVIGSHSGPGTMAIFCLATER